MVTVPTIRVGILRQLATTLSAITGWTVQRRGEEQSGNHAVTAIVFFLGEETNGLTSNQYQKSMTVGVELTARIEDADETVDEGNAFDYLDRLVAIGESKIHDPDSWGSNPQFTDVRIDGHDVADPPDGEEYSEVQALLRLSFKYRHDHRDPGAP